MNAIPKEQHEATYTLEMLSKAYEQAEIEVPKKEEEHFLLDHTHPIWNWLFPVMMVVVGAIVCWVGGYE